MIASKISFSYRASKSCNTDIFPIVSIEFLCPFWSFSSFLEATFCWFISLPFEIEQQRGIQCQSQVKRFHYCKSDVYVDITIIQFV